MLPVLKEKMRGEWVKKWQFFLIGQGFNPGKADGVFGPKTREATIGFQLKNKIIADGMVGQQSYTVAIQNGFEISRDTTDQSIHGYNFPPKPSFKPLLSNAERQQLFGKFSYNINQDYSITITDNWESNNIVRVEIPELKGITGVYNNIKIPVHTLAASQLTGLFKAWNSAGLINRILTWEGSYVPRMVRGSKTNLSNHAFGTAFDINYSWNKLGAVPALVGEKGCVRELVSIANEFGFYWGGHFSRLDGMHFEVAKIL